MAHQNVQDCDPHPETLAVQRHTVGVIQGMKELSLVIMLAVPGLEVLTTLSIRYTDNALLQMSNGVILIIAFITFLLTAVSQRLTKTNLAEGIGG